MGLTPEIMSDRPRAIIIMPRVAIKGGTCMREMTMPLTNPAVMPVRIPATMPTGIGIPMKVMKTPVMTADRVITVPTERSMPAVIMINVTPSAKMPFTAVARKIPLMFSHVKKTGEASEKNAKIKISAPKASSFCAAPERMIDRFSATGTSTLSAVAMVMPPPYDLSRRNRWLWLRLCQNDWQCFRLRPRPNAWWRRS